MESFTLNVDHRNVLNDYLNKKFNLIQFTKSTIKKEDLDGIELINEYNISYRSTSTPIPNSKKENICQWCADKFTSDVYGIPIQYVKTKDCEIFYGEGIYCNLRCAYADYKLRRNSVQYQFSNLYFSRISDIIGVKIIEAPDRRLHENFGGSLSKKLWHKIICEKSQHVKFYPSVSEFKVSFV